ncbi:hypothetical protein AKH00_12560 [Microbacterium sp. GCS4]|nr:hypothetical protein AKH00_12560 [Microbacterium sp. GCS4]
MRRADHVVEARHHERRQPQRREPRQQVDARQLHLELRAQRGRPGLLPHDQGALDEIGPVGCHLRAEQRFDDLLLQRTRRRSGIQSIDPRPPAVALRRGRSLRVGRHQTQSLHALGCGERERHRHDAAQRMPHQHDPRRQHPHQLGGLIPERGTVQHRPDRPALRVESRVRPQVAGAVHAREQDERSRHVSPSRHRR